MKPISADEIKMAEKILLPEGETFGGDGSERVQVIQEMDKSCDVVACPGSGKTTVLLAKLLILTNRMPFEDNRGICVLTHTNIAIDEIKKKAGIAGDKLFNYPNFFGTFQKFVDMYLAKQASIKYFNLAPTKINSDTSNKKLLTNFWKLDKYRNKLHKKLWASLFDKCAELRKEEIQEYFNLSDSEIDSFIEKVLKHKIISKKSPKSNNYILDKINTNQTNLKRILKKEHYVIIDIFSRIRKNVENLISERKEPKLIALTLDYKNQKIIDDIPFGFTTESGKEFIKLKEDIFSEGILSYRDAYDLGLRYINDYSSLSYAFNNRFKYVFVDEMQDTDYHQLKIIEDLFEDTDTNIQYFGDPNQSIYDFSVKKENVWKPGKDGKKILPIPDSKRFGNEISCILDKLKIDGSINLKSNSNNNTLKPHLFIYKQGEEYKILEKFVENIHNEQHKWIEELNGKIPVYKAIGWVAKERTKNEIDEGKLNISSYFPGFEKKSVKNKLVYDNLKFYLRKNNEAVKEKGAKIYYDSIINALLEVLDKGGVKRKVIVSKQIEGEILQIIQERSYTKTSLFEELEKKGQLKPLLKRMARWSRKIHMCTENYNSEIIKRIRRYIKYTLPKVFENLNVRKVTEFINEPQEVPGGNNSEHNENKGYIFKSENPEFKDIPIEVGTIHSVKGETHTATLYMETSYYSKFEGEKIMDHLLNKKNCLKEKGVRAIETLKMVHVGFSRPTHLLCFAVCEGRINKDEINKDEWKIIEV